MTISAIIIVYNLEQYIDAAIQSVLGQTRVPDEIIVVDDCSTDNSELVIKKYTAAIKYIRQPKRVGPLKNTWTGVKMAQGDIIAFLDGDDVWMPEKLEEIEQLFLSDNAICIASHDHVRVNENLQLINVLDETNFNVRRIVSNYNYPQWSDQFRRSILERRGYWLGSAYCIRRKFLKIVEFEAVIEQYQHAEWAYLDMTLGPFMVASNLNLAVGFVNKPLFKYRIHTNNSSAAGNSKQAMLSALNRIQHTNALTYLLISKFIKDPAIEKRYISLGGELMLLRMQYEGKKIAAIIHFFNVGRFLCKEKKFKKELFRLMITTFFGVTGLLKIKKQHALLAN